MNHDSTNAPLALTNAILASLLLELDHRGKGLPFAEVRNALRALSAEAVMVLLKDAARSGLVVLEPVERPTHVRLLCRPGAEGEDL